MSDESAAIDPSHFAQPNGGVAPAPAGDGGVLAQPNDMPPAGDTHPPSPSATVPLPICPAEKWEGSEGRSALACTSPRPSRRTSRTAFTAPPPESDDPLLAFAPYLHSAPRGNSIVPDKQRKFIATLAATGIVTQAARAIGASLEALYKLRHRPGAEGFAAAWDAALRIGAERLEDCALERALAEDWLHDGWTGRGDALLIYLLQRRGPFRVDERDLVPGHPVYERLKAEWAVDPSTSSG